MEEHRQARERKRRAESDDPRVGIGSAFRRSAARERRRRRKAGPCDTASSHCGHPGAARSARRDGRRRNAGRRRPWPSPHFVHPKSDGPHFGFRERWRRSGLRNASSLESSTWEKSEAPGCFPTDEIRNPSDHPTPNQPERTFNKESLSVFQSGLTTGAPQLQSCPLSASPLTSQIHPGWRG